MILAKTLELALQADETVDETLEEVSEEYYVFNMGPGGQPPRIRHETAADAMAEAQRLAGRSNGRFVVLQPLVAYQRIPPPTVPPPPTRLKTVMFVKQENYGGTD